MDKWNMNYKMRVTLTKKGWRYFQDVNNDADTYVISSTKDGTVIELPAWEIVVEFSAIIGRLDNYMSMWVELEHINNL